VNKTTQDPSRVYAGPTKRSADVNDYTALEAEVARSIEECARLRAQLDAALRRERALQWLIKRLEAASAVDQKKLALFVEASAEAAEVIRPTTPIREIDAALRRRRLALEIADAVASAAARVDAARTSDATKKEVAP
jgi:hypothetical protein